MRISTNMMYANANNNVNKNREQYLAAQEVLITQRKINRPSDDPIGAARALELQKRIDAFEQYNRNIEQARQFIDQTEIALSSVTESLERVIELGVDVNSPELGPGEYEAAAQEIENIFDELVRASNTKIGNRYVFAGYETTTAPFDDSGVYSGGIGDSIEVEINDNTYVEINFDGDEVFKNPVDIFAAIEDMRVAVAAGDQDAMSTQLPIVRDALDQIIAKTADIGAKSNRLEAAQFTNEELIGAFDVIISDIVDVDLTEATIDFAKTELIYEATMQVSSKVLNQSFLDFLR